MYRLKNPSKPQTDKAFDKRHHNLEIEDQGKSWKHLVDRQPTCLKLPRNWLHMSKWLGEKSHPTPNSVSPESVFQKWRVDTDILRPRKGNESLKNDKRKFFKQKGNERILEHHGKKDTERKKCYSCPFLPKSLWGSEQGYNAETWAGGREKTQSWWWVPTLHLLSTSCPYSNVCNGRENRKKNIQTSTINK